MVKDLNTIRKIIGDNIRRIRKEHNFKVEELAEAAGLVKGYWYQIEAGEPNVTIDALSNIARVLKVDVSDLLSQDTVTVFAQDGLDKKPKRRKAS